MSTPSSAISAPKHMDLDESLELLFTNVSAMVKGELQGTNNQLRLLEKMNKRVGDEYTSFGDVASGLSLFVEQLSRKNSGFDECVQQMESIDKQVKEFEVMISMLDNHVCSLEKKIRSAYNDSPS